ncbi:MAG: hypothetical protein KGO93_05890 [Cyanobacteria bacterium REEB446]|nr:hypothetical protein [Cyanobacteria bacterium REEB446]
MGESVLKSKDGKSVAKLPHLPVNHATHINLTKLAEDNFILENLCILPMIFQSDGAQLKEGEQVSFDFKSNEIVPFSRVLVSKDTLLDLYRQLKQLGVEIN